MKTLLLIPVIVLLALHSTRAQNDSVAVNKIYHTWIKIKAERERDSRLNFYINDSVIMLPCKYKQTDYLNGRFDFSKTEAGNISMVQIRKNPGDGKDVLADDFMIVLYGGKSGDFSGYSDQNPYFGEVKDLEASVINGVAAVAGSILLAVLSGATSGNTTLTVAKAHSHRQEPPSAKDMENMNSRSLNGLQLNGNHAGFSFVPLHDTVVDFDGNVYHTAALGGMVIMAEDLMVTHFHNGKEIPCTKDSTGLSAIVIPAYCNYRSDSGITSVNGRLYNWYAVNDTSRICPKNWHIPSYGEWTSLINCLGGTNKAAGKLMENFFVTGKVCSWWSSTGQNNGHAQSLYLDQNSMEAKLKVTTGNSGLPVRCIRDY